MIQKEESNMRHTWKDEFNLIWDHYKKSHVAQDGCIVWGTQGNKMVVVLLNSDETSVAAARVRVCSCETPPVAFSFILH